MGEANPALSARIEDYLEELYLLESDGSGGKAAHPLCECEDKLPPPPSVGHSCPSRGITVTDLADRLRITKGTVTSTVQRLVELGMVEHERYGALHLTPEGRRRGMEVFRRHEGFRAFFHEMLGLDLERSSEMACCMEHYVDPVTEERLYALLEYFRRARADREPWVSGLEKRLLEFPS